MNDLTGASIISAGTQFFGDWMNRKREERQKKNSKELTKYAHDLNYEMWKKTNYGAQMEQMKDAGLNPAMMYGQGGAGGMTGGQSGGSAPMSAESNMNVIGQAQQMANIDLAKSQADKNRAEAENLRGVDRDKKGAETISILQGVENQKAQKLLTEAQTKNTRIANELAGKSLDTQLYILERQANYIDRQINQIDISNTLDANTRKNKELLLKSQLAGQLIQNKATAKGIEVSDTQIKKMNAEIMKWQEELSQGWTALDQKQKEVEIKNFEAIIKADYPNFQNVLGAGMEEFIRGFDSIFGTKRDRYDNRPK